MNWKSFLINWILLPLLKDAGKKVVDAATSDQKGEQ